MSDAHVSPELVLVAPPDVAERARLALPERPWEAFAPRRAAAPGDGPAVPDDGRAVQAGAARRRRRPASITRRRVAMLAATPLFAIAAVAISGRLNTIHPAPAVRAAGPPIEIEVPPVERLAAPVPRPIAGGGYVFGGSLREHGSFQVDATSRFIVSLHVRTRCGGDVSLPRIPIVGGERFSFTGNVGAGGPGESPGPRHVTLQGTFHGPRVVRGSIRIGSGRCDTGPLRLAARLS
jgi:hypothetical protein